MKYDYHKLATLAATIANVECWNFTTGEKFSLPAGTTIKAEHAYDATHSTCMVVWTDGSHLGISLPTEANPSRMGYRFIVKNAALSAATGLKLPKRTRDLVGDMMAFESGELSPVKAKRLLRGLKRDGLLAGLQGSYGAAAARMGV